ncbi:MAG: ergothioneine biosynthesis protein EgtB [Parasynechococcus sp.]
MLLDTLLEVRDRSEALIARLEPEDLGLQGMADASPPKWHLAHTTWFFDTFVLQPHLASHTPCDPRWSYQFNSYYETVGERHPRSERGVLSRPPVREILAWRAEVDAGLKQLLSNEPTPELQTLVELGLQHEQQHQELLLMDLLDGFSRQPLEPSYGIDADLQTSTVRPQWLACDGGVVEIGAHKNGFHFDNETPRHRVWLDPFQISDELVSNAEYQAFIDDGGYRRPELWMSDGWGLVQQRGWNQPRYWRDTHDEFGLAGRQRRDPAAPVRHLSWFEADAFARWSACRLPTEAEWEHACALHGIAMHHAHGVLWQWTASPYRPYPGFCPPPGAIGEYNGKFMSSQMVLRGSSWLTPPGHGRDTYRNFFPPSSRWMAAGVRLAR